MEITLSKILDAANNIEEIDGISPEIIRLVGAAYCAGQSDARAEERLLNRMAASRAIRSRYWRLVKNTTDLFNQRAVDGLRQEAAEFKGGIYTV